MSESAGDPQVGRAGRRSTAETVRLAPTLPVDVTAIAVVAVVLVVAARAAPTGSVLPDVLLVGCGAVIVVVAGAFGPWWATLFALGVATVTVGSVPLVVLGSVGLVVGLVVAGLRRDGPASNSVLIGLALNLLVRSEFDGALGASAVIGVGASAVVLVAALVGAPGRVIRVSLIGAGAIVALGALAVAGVAFAGLGVRDDAKVAVDEARAAVDLLSAGNYEEAADGLDLAASSFEEVDGALGGPLALPSRMIPIVAQNVRAGAELSSSAASTLREAAAALREIDPSELRVDGGAIDLDAVRAVEGPLRRVHDALRDLRSTSADVRSVWLVDRLTEELDELELDLDEEEPRLQNAIDAVRLAPALLGGEGERRYLVLFTTPAEARGLGGFIGNYAELSVDGGRIEIVESARRSELAAVLDTRSVRCETCSAEFLARYGIHGFSSGDGGTVDGAVWSNLTMSPSFPDVAQVAAELYPESGGLEVDGVFVMDPYVIAALMQYSGSVDVPELGLTIEPDSAAEYILRDQYEFAVQGLNDERIDALDTLAGVVFSRLLDGSLPEPATLAADMAPLISERRLLGWTTDPDEQALFERVGFLGSVPELGVDGGFSVVLNNAAANKVDAFVERSVEIEIEPSSDGARTMHASVELRNGAPSEGLTDYAIGNAVGLPRGADRLLVTFFGPPRLTSLLVDGEPAPFESLPEAGWSTYTLSVDIESMGSLRFDLEFALDAGRIGSGAEDLVLFEQPLAYRT
jgi:Protein of unknown function (DUF4012)